MLCLDIVDDIIPFDGACSEVKITSISKSNYGNNIYDNVGPKQSNKIARARSTLANLNITEPCFSVLLECKNP